MEIAVTEYLVRVVVIEPPTRLDAAHASRLRIKLDEMIDKGVVNFVIDMRQVRFLDSAGIAVLINLLKHTRLVKGDVKLVWPVNVEVQHFLTMSGFDRVFENFSVVDDAIKRFFNVATANF